MPTIDAPTAATLADRVAELERRLAALESAGRVPATEPDPMDPVDPMDPDTFWALLGLEQRLSDPGGVLLTGTVTLPTGARARWQESLGTADLLDLDDSAIAECLAALGHPVRLQILRLVLAGIDTASGMTGSEQLHTSGQVYHHLRQLTGTGWLRMAGRGRYEVPPARIVPLLVTQLAARS